MGTRLKIYCKLVLVVRREEDSIPRYLNLGTEKYNDKTAKFYTDISLFTCKTKLEMDASVLFY
jgi:polyphosphate kinase